MINTELRIGNNVYFDFHKDSGGRKIIEVFAKDLANMEKERMLKSYSGIPITKERLLNCGFKFECGTEYVIGKISLECRNDDLCIPREKKEKLKDMFGLWIGDHHIRELKFMHEVQNIYFDLYAKKLKSIGKK